MKLPANRYQTTAAASAKSRGILDKTAIVLSATCIAHCLVLPMGFTLLPIINVTLLPDQVFHILMLLFILPASILALSLGCREHKDFVTLALGTLGLGILTFTAFWGHQLFTLTGERIMTSIGGLILALAHIRNYLICTRNHCDHNQHGG